jgi:Late competence development protein ComFB
VYKNIIEDFVVKEARSQITTTQSKVGFDLDLSAVVAIALNRLQPLYATTFNGWMSQRWLAIQDYSEEITEAVSAAIVIVKHGYPLNEDSSLPESELSCKAYTLVRVSRVLGREDIRWQEIPKVLEAALIQKWQATTPPEISVSNRSLVVDIKAYLDRNKQVQPEKIYTEKKDELPVTEQKELESYLLRAKLGISNVMEKIVEVAATHIMRKWSDDEKQQINFDQMAAFSLNRLPPMYATSARGYQFLRQKAVNELHQEITLIVFDALLHVKNMPSFENAPIPIYRFEREMDKIFPELRRILNCPDLTWDNLADIVEDALR